MIASKRQVTQDEGGKRIINRKKSEEREEAGRDRSTCHDQAFHFGGGANGRISAFFELYVVPKFCERAVFTACGNTSRRLAPADRVVCS